MYSNLPPEFVSTGVWIWENFGKEIFKTTAAQIGRQFEKQWGKFEWKLAAHNYRKAVYNLYSTMRVLGNPNPIVVEDIFTDLYLLDKPNALIRYDIQGLQQKQQELSVIKHDGTNSIYEKFLDNIHHNKDRVNAYEFIQSNKRIFILGKPGAGKTTLLKYITIQAAKGNINKIPIFISLIDWSQSRLELMEYIKQQFEICHFPDALTFIVELLLKKGRAIVLFDGLDEVNVENNKREKIIRVLNQFTNQYTIQPDTINGQPNSDNIFIITCRVAATDYSFEKFPYVEIADFTPKQIDSFARKWFAQQPKKFKSFTKELVKRENSGLREMAQTPILLSLLCLNFEETMMFPIRRVEVYQEAIDALIKKWDASREIRRDEIYHGLSPVRKQQLFSNLAAEYFEKGEIFFREDELSEKIRNFLEKLPNSENKEYLDGEVILKSIEAQHGLLVERAYKIHSFSHLTFQEYFTARYIVEQSNDTTIRSMIKHFNEDRWHEILLLVASLLPNADFFFLAFRAEINKMVNKDKKIIAVLDWATKKAPDYLGDIKNIASARMYTISQALSVSRSNTETYRSLLSQLVYDLDTDVIKSHSFANLGNISNDFSENFRKALISNLPSVEDTYWSPISRLEYSAIRLGHPNFAGIIHHLPPINKQLSDEDLNATIQDLRESMIKFRNIGHNWQLNVNQTKMLESYLKANIFMAECLDQSSVSNRKDLENSVLSTIN